MKVRAEWESGERKGKGREVEIGVGGRGRIDFAPSTKS